MQLCVRIHMRISGGSGLTSCSCHRATKRRESLRQTWSDYHGTMRRGGQCCEDVPGKNGLNTSAQGRAYPKSAVRGSFKRGV
eukprot:2795832-Pyramimonas_sp.AAC.1